MLHLHERPNAADAALARAIVEMASCARKTAAREIKNRARLMLVSDEQVEKTLYSLDAHFAFQTPELLIRSALAALERERNSPRRHFGFGAEVPAINARAALLVGRFWRRHPEKKRGF